MVVIHFCLNQVYTHLLYPGFLSPFISLSALHCGEPHKNISLSIRSHDLSLSICGISNSSLDIIASETERPTWCYKGQFGIFCERGANSGLISSQSVAPLVRLIIWCALNDTHLCVLSVQKNLPRTVYISLSAEWMAVALIGLCICAW